MQVTSTLEHRLNAFGFGINGFHYQRMESD